MPFGEEPNYRVLLELSKRIKTFTESASIDDRVIQDIHKHIASTEKLVFLGFAFHKLNMKLITPNKKSNSNVVKCYASTYGISKYDLEVVKSYIEGMSSLRTFIYTQEVTCVDFFNKFWRALAF